MTLNIKPMLFAKFVINEKNTHHHNNLHTTKGIQVVSLMYDGDVCSSYGLCLQAVTAKRAKRHHDPIGQQPMQQPLFHQEPN